MARNKIFFHAGPQGVMTGWGDLVRSCDAAGIPVGVMSMEGEGVGDIVALWDKGSHVPHVPCVRYMPKDNWYSTQDVPLYGKDIGVHAAEWWAWQKSMFGPEVLRYPGRIVVKMGNELDKNEADWLGYFFKEVGRLALEDPDGPFVIAPFGWASGTPEKWAWETPGMLAYLRFAAEHPDNLWVCVHEYSYDVSDILDGFPYKVGRFKALFDICDKHEIRRPNVVIHEWGWEAHGIPPLHTAMADIDKVAEIYAKYPEVKFAGTWTTQSWQGSDIEKDVAALIPHVKTLTLDKVYPDPEEPEDPPAEKALGVDVSRWQGTMDWAKTKAAGVEFAFIRSTVGTSYVDSQFDKNWKGSGEQGIYRAPYHYLLEVGDPVSQALHFVSLIPEDTDLPPVVDIEAAGLSMEFIKTFLISFEQHAGEKPLIYTGPGFWNRVVGHTDWAKSYPLWVAHWGVDDPLLPAGWDDWDFWQYTSSGSGSEYGAQSTMIDLDRFHGTSEELAEYVAEYTKVQEPCFEIPPFTRTILVHPEEKTKEEAEFVENATTQGLLVDGKTRLIGLSGWSVHGPMKDIWDMVQEGKTQSRLLILNGHRIGDGLVASWFARYCPALLPYVRFYVTGLPEPPEPPEPWEPKKYYLYVRFPFPEPPEPSEPPEPPEPPVKKYDLADYINGDGRRYYLASAGKSTQELLQTQWGHGVWYQVKNTAWESFAVDSQFIRRDTDTSPGGGRYYTQRLGDLPAPWLPRHMAVGEEYHTGPITLRFFTLDKCTLESTHTVADTRKFVAHHDVWESRWGIELYNVAEIEWVNGGERYFYAKDYGLVGWERIHQDPYTPQWTSVSELVHDDGRNDRMKGCFGGG